VGGRCEACRCPVIELEPGTFTLPPGLQQSGHENAYCAEQTIGIYQAWPDATLNRRIREMDFYFGF
jgi:hypothetical protein